MPQGDKGRYTSKQKRQAEHIEESEKKRGRGGKTAERIAWATVNKQDGGGKKAKRAGRSRSTRTRNRQRAGAQARRGRAMRTTRMARTSHASRSRT